MYPTLAERVGVRGTLNQLGVWRVPLTRRPMKALDGDLSLQAGNDLEDDVRLAELRAKSAPRHRRSNRAPATARRPTLVQEIPLRPIRTVQYRARIDGTGWIRGRCSAPERATPGDGDRHRS